MALELWGRGLLPRLSCAWARRGQDTSAWKSRTRVGHCYLEGVLSTSVAGTVGEGYGPCVSLDVCVLPVAREGICPVDMSL